MKRNVKWIIPVVAGAIAGGLLALLFTPVKGSELRKKIAGTGNRLSDNLTDLFAGSKQKIGKAKERVILQDEMMEN